MGCTPERNASLSRSSGQSAKDNNMRTIATLLVAVTAFLGPVSVASAQQAQVDFDEVGTILHRNVDLHGGVLRIEPLRDDLHVSLYGVLVPAELAGGGWIAMTRGSGGTAVMMADLPLKEDEVGAVMSAVLNNGLEVATLHPDQLSESPRLFTLHV